MLDIGWTELLVIGIIALIVVGPKDLPKMFRVLGQFTAKARGMAREFQRAMDDAAEQSGVKDVASDLRKATSTKEMGLDGLDKLKSTRPKDFLRDRVKDRLKTGAKVDETADAKTPAAPGTGAAATPSATAAAEEAADAEDALDTVGTDDARARGAHAGPAPEPVSGSPAKSADAAANPARSPDRGVPGTTAPDGKADT